jgi:hypothetical protein
VLTGIAERGFEAPCWVHARRPFFVLADVEANARRKVQGRSTSVISPLAVEAVRRIDRLFDIERSINGQSVEGRRRARQGLSAPLIADLECWLRQQRPKLSRGNDLARRGERHKRFSILSHGPPSCMRLGSACPSNPRFSFCTKGRAAGVIPGI